MKTIALLCLLAATSLATEWVPANTPCPIGMVRMGPLPYTGSMKPALQGGEYMYCEPYWGQPFRAAPGLSGDILILDTRYGPRTHRATAQSKTAVWTTGDACRRSDGATGKQHIRYIVRYVLRQ